MKLRMLLANLRRLKIDIRLCTSLLCHLSSCMLCSVADAAHGYVRGDLVQLCKEGTDI